MPPQENQATQTPETESLIEQVPAASPVQPSLVVTPSPDTTATQPVAQQAAPADSKSQPTSYPVYSFNEWTRQQQASPILLWTFRTGFASIFIVNAIYAAVHPQEFLSLLEQNVIARAIGHADLLIKVTTINDLLLGILILTGWRSKLITAWAGLWLLLVAGLKLMNLFF